MKWKCNNCMYGPCVYESYNCREYDDINPKIEKCPRGMFAAIWLMTEEEPEQKDESSGLPEWLKVGNFVKFGGCNPVCRIEGYDTEQKILSISRKVWGEDRTVKHDVHCEAGWGEAQVVFPKPYTFETAPVMLKIRRKLDQASRLIKLYCFNGECWGYINEYSYLSFEDALRDYEQLDGWPCGTFEGEVEE